MTEGRSLVQAYALMLGLTLTGVAVIGIVVNSSFTAGSGVEAEKFLGFPFNGWHNAVHLATGVFGVAVAASYRYARVYALSVGLVYVLLAILGIIGFGDSPGRPDTILNLVPINVADNFVHLTVGVAGLCVAQAGRQLGGAAYGLRSGD